MFLSAVAAEPEKGEGGGGGGVQHLRPVRDPLHEGIRPHQQQGRGPEDFAVVVHLKENAKAEEELPGQGSDCCLGRESA